MNRLPFVWNELTPLINELKKPLEQLTVYSELYRSGKTVFAQPFSITLWHTDGSGLKCFSQMTDLAERVEVGSLHFERVAERSTESLDLNIPFVDIEAIFVLSIEESGTVAESGLVLIGEDGKELTIVAADYPFGLAISGVPIDHYTFRSEYLLHEYQKRQMI
jgi:hypothetical protein